jgi:hypothetical protein
VDDVFALRGARRAPEARDIRQQGFKFLANRPASIRTQRFDAISGGKSALSIIIISHGQQGAQINIILGPMRTPGENLHRDQMARRRDRHAKPTGNLDDVGALTDVGFDSRRGEQEIDNNAFGGLARR